MLLSITRKDPLLACPHISPRSRPCTRPASNAVDAIDAALRSVLLGQCHPEDLQVLTRLVDQV